MSTRYPFLPDPLGFNLFFIAFRTRWIDGGLYISLWRWAHSDGEKVFWEKFQGCGTVRNDGMNEGSVLRCNSDTH